MMLHVRDRGLSQADGARPKSHPPTAACSGAQEPAVKPEGEQVDERKRERTLPRARQRAICGKPLRKRPDDRGVKSPQNCVRGSL